MDNQKNYTRGVIFSLIACISLGIVGIIDKVGTLQTNNPFIFSSQSLLFSLLFTVIFALIYFKGLPVRETKSISFSSWRLIILVGILASGLFILFRFLGLTQSTGTFATLSQIVTTSLTAIFARIFLKEKLSKSFWGIFLIILVSMYFVSIGKFAFASVKQGDLFILFGTLFLAAGNIFSKIVVHRVNPVLVSAARFLIGFIFLAIASIILMNHQTISNPFSIWVILSGLLWSTLVITFNLALKRIGVTLSTSILMMAPVITMILEYSFLQFHFTLVQVIAALVVVLGGVAIIFASGSPKLR